MNNNFGISDQSFNTILDLLKQHAEIEYAKIFGSRAIGNFKDGSDIDKSIHGANINMDTIHKLKYQLSESIIPYYIDIVDYKMIKNTDLTLHIDTYGKLFYNKSANNQITK